ncbi:hypothetical protein LPJCHP_LPJCHP_06590, partial [Dysosmobacter welbionis]
RTVAGIALIRRKGMPGLPFSGKKAAGNSILHHL